MKNIILILFLLFGINNIIPTLSSNAYAMSLDDDEEDAEDVQDLLDMAKKAGKNESFSKANELLKKAKQYSINNEDVNDIKNYVDVKKQKRDARLERARLVKLEKQRLARLEREGQERARLARIEKEKVYSSSSSGYSSSSTSSSSSKKFNCSYKCRTDEVFLSSYYKMGTVQVRATNEYMAKERIRSSIKNQCRKSRDKKGNLMRFGSIDCRIDYN